MNRPTRFFSNRQEKAVANIIKGKQTRNSGATDLTHILIECKI